MRRIKKFSNVLVVLIALVSMFAMGIKVSATVGTTFDEDGFTYTILTDNVNNKTVEISGFVGGEPTTNDLDIKSTVSDGNNTYTVVAIGESAFFNLDLTRVRIPNSITTIGDYAFAGNLLTDFIIPEGVTIIGQEVFSFNALTSIVIPNSVVTIGEAAFAWNQLTSVTISENITNIPQAAFVDNLLTNVVIPEGVTTIGYSAFAVNNLTSITIPKNVETIAENAFAENNISTIYLANKDKLSVLTADNLWHLIARKEDDSLSNIVGIYAPEIGTIEYQDATSITKKVGDTFELQVNTNLVYQQISRFNDDTGEFMDPAEDAPTVPCDLPYDTTIQWYKDGVTIEGSINAIYSEEAQEVGTYTYYAVVEGKTLTEIMVTIVSIDTTVPINPIDPTNPTSGDMDKPQIIVDVNKDKDVVVLSTKNKVNTTDDTNALLFIALLFVSGIVLGLRKKNKRSTIY